ncbi:MAG: hypothetical protein PHS62_04245, partial [Patescibacteria group bacterium]|nr:hypothetical protein [Patescibacteria group bacterium]
MTPKDFLTKKIPLSVALLIIVAAATCTEQLFLQGIQTNNRVCDAIARIDLTSGRQLNLNPWLNNVKDKVALANANVPLIPGAQRLTFNSQDLVRYRVDAPAVIVAGFYRQALADQGWRAATKAVANPALEKLTITYVENPLSNKTDVTYAYAPISASKVLGVKIAEADTTASSGSTAPTETAPAPEPQPAPQPTPQPTQDPNQIMPPSQPNPPTPPTDGGQYQMPPNQPNTNQMDFYRPMQPISGDQQNGQNNNQSPTNQGSQTCRVNGVEMPGSCEQYNNQGSMNQGQMMNQGGQMGQQGPSEEEMKKMDEQRFKDMKRGLSQFATGAKSMKRNLARVKTAISKCGVNLPEELENALAQTDSLVEKIKAAETADALDEIVGDVQDVGSVMQDWGPRMGDLSRLCQMLKQADRDAKQFDRNVKRLEAQVKANKKVDLSEPLNEYKAAVAAQKEVLAQAKELAKTDPDEALAKIEDDFYGNMDNVGSLQMQI